MLKDYVDEFVISESNRTHSGSPIKYELKKTIKKLGLPIEKIKIIELDIPDNKDLVIERIDHLNCSFDYKESDNQTNLKSLRARVIERMQKDALLKVLNDYDDKTIFIHSDSDEIIRPDSIEFIVNTVIANSNVLIKIPLVLLDGRADLRRYVKSTDKPTPWNGGMFVCIKDHLKNNTPTELRSCNNSKYQVTYITHNNETIEDMGWHFSWMGNNDLRQIKRKAMSHHDDFFPTTIFNAKYSSDEANDFFDNYIISEGNISSSGEKDSVLKKYPLENLPKEVFTLSRVLSFLLPGLDKSEILKSAYSNRCSVHGEINEHLSTLSELAFSCKHVTEMGVNTGNSTLAFLNSDVILRSYDLYINDNVSRFFDIAKQENKDVKYIQGDTRIINIEKTDLLFIDTLHTYDQLKIELNRHCNKVRKYIVFHDTQTFGTIGEDGGLGLLPAILDFIIEHVVLRQSLQQLAHVPLGLGGAIAHRFVPRPQHHHTVDRREAGRYRAVGRFVRLPLQCEYPGFRGGKERVVLRVVQHIGQGGVQEFELRQYFLHFAQVPAFFQPLVLHPRDHAGIPAAHFLACILVGLHRGYQHLFQLLQVEVVRTHHILDVPHADDVAGDVVPFLIVEQAHPIYFLVPLLARYFALSPATISWVMFRSLLPTQICPPFCTLKM